MSIATSMIKLFAYPFPSCSTMTDLTSDTVPTVDTEGVAPAPATTPAPAACTPAKRLSGVVGDSVAVAPVTADSAQPGAAPAAAAAAHDALAHLAVGVNPQLVREAAAQAGRFIPVDVPGVCVCVGGGGAGVRVVAEGEREAGRENEVGRNGKDGGKGGQIQTGMGKKERVLGKSVRNAGSRVPCRRRLCACVCVCVSPHMRAAGSSLQVACLRVRVQGPSAGARVRQMVQRGRRGSARLCRGEWLVLAAVHAVQAMATWCGNRGMARGGMGIDAHVWYDHVNMCAQAPVPFLYAPTSTGLPMTHPCGWLGAAPPVASPPCSSPATCAG